jgi:putative ribosome biogenesis GTPase RsgA
MILFEINIIFQLQKNIEKLIMYFYEKRIEKMIIIIKIDLEKIKE